MKMKDLNDFKNRILLAEIHQQERSDIFSELCKEAEFIAKYIKSEYQGKDSSYVLFQKIAIKINYLRNLVALCDDLQKQGLKLQWVVQTEDNYYRDCFQAEIKRGTAILKLLRPYVLKYTESWPAERKRADLDGDTGKFFSGWYLNI